MNLIASKREAFMSHYRSIFDNIVPWHYVTEAEKKDGFQDAMFAEWLEMTSRNIWFVPTYITDLWYIEYLEAYIEVKGNIADWNLEAIRQRSERTKQNYEHSRRDLFQKTGDYIDQGTKGAINRGRFFYDWFLTYITPYFQTDDPRKDFPSRSKIYQDYLDYVNQYISENGNEYQWNIGLMEKDVENVKKEEDSEIPRFPTIEYC